MATLFRCEHGNHHHDCKDCELTALREKLAERDARIAEYVKWAEYACRRFTEETGKDLQSEAS